MMTDDDRTFRRPGRRSLEIRCRSGALRPAEGREAPGVLPELEITVGAAHGETVVVTLAGEIDLRSADALRDRLVELHGSGFRRLVVDFGEVLFCDASGLGALVAVHNRISERGGEIRLARVRAAQRRLLRITRLHRLFALYGTVEDAVAEEDSSATFPRG
ncbi:STAS domain-containing protein [Spirillospora sp. CA-294931]|uniref:STAS domain-containing protein n=1 Tax=Spirillospora sp. CA-294931 TaxID=3240042 RepID=UPI003D9473BD